MEDDRYEGIVDRLAAIEEELRDLAYDRLRDRARDPDSEAGKKDASEHGREITLPSAPMHAGRARHNLKCRALSSLAEGRSLLQRFP